MARLTDPQKLRIVRELARYQRPSQVVTAIKEEFGATVSPQQVEAYDPTKYAGRRLSKHWKDVFNATRERYLHEVSDVPLAHRGYRLQQLQEQLDRAKAMGKNGNPQLVKELTIEAEKIMGELYTNRRILEHDARGNLAKLLGVDVSDLPDDADA